MLYYAQVFFFFAALFLAAFVAEAIGEENCLSYSIPTVNTQRYIRGKAHILRSYLIGEEVAGYFISKASAKLKLNSRSRVRLSFSYPMKRSMVGLPYHINKVAILLNANYVFLKDFTNKCQNLGLNLFPQAHFKLPSFTVPKQILKHCEHGCPLKLVVWGGFH